MDRDVRPYNNNVDNEVYNYFVMRNACRAPEFSLLIDGSSHFFYNLSTDGQSNVIFVIVLLLVYVIQPTL